MKDVSMISFACPITSLGPGLTQEQIAAAEAALGQEIPGAYKRLLRFTNGCKLVHCVFFLPRSAARPDGKLEGVRHLMGVGLKPAGHDLVAWNKMFGDQFPSSSFTFASDSGGNDYLVFSAGPRRGEVAFRDHETGELNPLASSIDEFFQHLVPRDAPEVLADFPDPEGVVAVKITRVATKKPAAKKPAAKKTAAKRAASVKKPAAKKLAARKTAKKTAAKARRTSKRG